jgi:hypothetical protein
MTCNDVCVVNSSYFGVAVVSSMFCHIHKGVEHICVSI